MTEAEACALFLSLGGEPGARDIIFLDGEVTGTGQYTSTHCGRAARVYIDGTEIARSFWLGHRNLIPGGAPLRDTTLEELARLIQHAQAWSAGEIEWNPT